MGRLNHHLVWASTGKALWRLWQDCTDGQTQPSSCLGEHWEGSVKALARLHWWADSTIILCGQALRRHCEGSGKTALMGRLNHHLVWASTGKALARLHWWADSTIILFGQALGRLWKDCTDGQTQPSSCVGKHWEGSGKTALMGRLNHYLVWASTGKALARLHWWADSTIILCGQALGRHCEGSGKTALMGRLNHHLVWASTGKALARLHWWADLTIILCGQALERLWQDCTDGQT